MPTELIIAAVAVVILVIIIVVVAISMRSRRTDEIEDRLGRYTEYESYVDLSEEGAETKDDEPSQFTKTLDNVLTQREFGQNTKVSLAKADLKITVAEYFAIQVIATIAAFAVVTLLRGLVLGIVAAAMGFFGPRIYVSRRQSGRYIKFEEQLPDTVSLWVNGLRSGYSVLQAMEAIAKEAPDPTASEFRRVVQEVQLGIAMEDALDHLLIRMESEDLDLIVTAVNIQREVGGNLAEILDVIGHTIRERIKLKGEVRVLTSQGRYTGYLISGLPILLALLLMVISPDYMGGMFTNRLCGWPMLGLGLGLIGMGTAAIARIVDIDY